MSNRYDRRANALDICVKGSGVQDVPKLADATLMTDFPINLRSIFLAKRSSFFNIYFFN